MQIVKKTTVETGAEVSTSYALYCSSAEVSALMVFLGIVFSNHVPDLPSSIQDFVKQQLTESEQLILVRMLWSIIRQF